VYQEVSQRFEIISKDGGFVFAAIHNIVGNVPEENLLALFRGSRQEFCAQLQELERQAVATR